MRVTKEVDPPKKASSSPGKEPPVKSSAVTSVLRNAIPLPMPVSQMVASTITRDNKLGWENLHPTEQYELARSVMNARQRTGSNKGGTEYADYSPQVERDISSLGGNFANVALGTVFSPEFRTATTMGRVSYDYNPKTDIYTVYDSYDFSPTSSAKTSYAAVRGAAGKVGVSEGKPNVVATFKGGDYSVSRPEGGSTYKEISDFTTSVGENVSSRLESIGDAGAELYNKIYGYLSNW